MATMYEDHTLEVSMTEVVTMLRKRYSVLPYGEKPDLRVEVSSVGNKPEVTAQKLRLKWRSEKDVQCDPVEGPPPKSD